MSFRGGHVRQPMKITNYNQLLEPNCFEENPRLLGGCRHVLA